MRAQSTAADISEPQTPARSNGGDVGEPSSLKSPTPAAAAAAAVIKDDDDRAISPVSTTSSASEPPLAQKVKMNGNHTTKRPTTPTPVPVPVPAPSTPIKQQPIDLPTSNSVAPPAAAATTTTTTTTTSSPSRTSVRSYELETFHFINIHDPTFFFSFTFFSYLNGYPVPCKP